MTPDHLEDNVSLFVLGELEGLELATFELALTRDHALQAAVRDYSETVGAVAARAGIAGEPSPDVWAAIERRARPSSVRGIAAMESRRRRTIHVWLWPAAAALLLALNLVQWFRPRGTTASSPVDRTAVASDSSQNRAGARAGTTSAPGEKNATDVGSAENATTSAASGEGTRPAATTRDLETEYRQLQADYARLSQLVLPLLDTPLVDYRDSRVWIAEMREKAGPNDTSTVIGLWDRARELAPEHGVAVLPDRWRLAGGVVVNPDSWLRPGGTGMASAAPMPSPTPTPESAPPTFAMALLNGTEGLGYLDLYNLPTVPAGTEMKVWLKSEGDAAYTDVGVVPRTLVGGSGALVFRVPTSETTKPQHVIITIEPQVPRTQPSGPTILEGP